MSEFTNSLFPQIGQLGRPILVTGHTGFVGTWLISVLDELEVPWVGFSQKAQTGSMFENLDFLSKKEQELGDLRDEKLLARFVKKSNPSAVIHLAADAIVLQAIKTPYSVFHNNFNSTLSLVSEYEKKSSIQRMLVSTTDKVYKNSNLNIAYKESDPLEGSEPYSESKVATEAIIRGFNTLLPVNRRILVARAGNIIGGGDVAINRLIPDIVRGKISSSKINLRMPEATRPWQHVLDVVFGYLFYLEKSLVASSIPLALNFSGFNSSKSVRYIANRMIQSGFIPKQLVDYTNESENKFPPVEKSTLDLDPSSAKRELNWENVYDVDTALDITIQWWLGILQEKQNPKIVTKSQIRTYMSKVAKYYSE